MDIFTVVWLSWLGFFLVAEGYALFNKKTGDTLSEKVWSWFAVKPREEGAAPTAGVRIRRIGLLAFLAWLTVHFLTGGDFI